MRMRLAGWVGVVFLLAPCVAGAVTPTEMIDDRIGKVLSILGDETLAGEEGRAEKIERIRSVAGDMFDFEELSKRTLGRNWRNFSAGERERFVELYRRLLENVYIDRILAYKDEKVDIYREQNLSADKVEVFTHVITASAKIPMSYRMMRRNGAWRVYDVIIEGVSMTQNYRSQFRSMLKKDKPADLLEALRDKTENPS